MRGVGGPLLCIGDLLADVADDDGADGEQQEATTSSPSSPTAVSREPVHPSDLLRLFQDNYNQLVESLEGTSHSWTASMLKLCSALKTADKLVNSADSNNRSLLEKIAELESILKRGDSVVETAKAMGSSLKFV